MQIWPELAEVSRLPRPADRPARAAIGYTKERHPAWRRAALTTVLAVGCGMLGALCGALIEMGVWRLLVGLGAVSP